MTNQEYRKVFAETVTDVKEILDNLGVQYETPSMTFKINTRAVNRWGQCKYIGGYNSGRVEINISKKVFDHATDIQVLKNTIAHEFLHAITPNSGHTGKWKQLAEMITRTGKYHVERTVTREEQQAVNMDKVKTSGYEIHCSKCGVLATYQRRSKAVKHIEAGNNAGYRCKKCKGTDLSVKVK